MMWGFRGRSALDDDDGGKLWLKKGPGQHIRTVLLREKRSIQARTTPEHE